MKSVYYKATIRKEEIHFEKKKIKKYKNKKVIKFNRRIHPIHFKWHSKSTTLRFIQSVRVFSFLLILHFNFFLAFLIFHLNEEKK